jgi:hypothetical protein
VEGGCDEGLAIRIEPEPCAVVREGGYEHSPANVQPLARVYVLEQGYRQFGQELLSTRIAREWRLKEC